MIEFKAYIDGAETGGLKFAFCSALVSDEVEAAKQVGEVLLLDRMARMFGGSIEPTPEGLAEVSPMILLVLVALGYAEIRIEGDCLQYATLGQKPGLDAAEKVLREIVEGRERKPGEFLAQVTVVVEVDIPQEAASG